MGPALPNHARRRGPRHHGLGIPGLKGWTATDVLLVAIIVFAPLARGAVHVVPALVLGFLCLALYALWALGRIRDGKPMRVGLLGAVLLAAAIYSLFQLVPLPPALLAALSPVAAEIRDSAHGWASGWQPLALETHGAAFGALRRISCVLIFLVAANRYADRQRRRLPLGALAAAAGLVVLWGFVDVSGRPGAAEHDVWGELLSMRIRGTFGNPNHASAYFTLGTFAALALTASLAPRPGAVFACLGGLITIGLLLTFSRAGIIAFAVAAAVLVVFLLARSAIKRSFPRRTLIACGVLLLAPMTAALVGRGPLMAKMSLLATFDRVTADAKYRLQRESLGFVRDFLPTGAGDWGFSQAFFRYKQMEEPFTFTHIENEYLQQLADYGVPFGALPVLAILAAGGIAIARRRKGTTAIFIAAALLAMALHSISDFSMATGAVSTALFLLLGLLVGPPAPRTEQPALSPEPGAVPDRPAPTWRVRGLPALVAAGAGVVALVAAVSTSGHSLAADRARVKQTLAGGDPVALVREAAEAAARHPADYFIPLLVGDFLLDRDPKAAARWLNRSLYLAPHHPETHLATARLLRRRGALRQAVLEYRLAYRASTATSRAPILQEVWHMRGVSEDVFGTTNTVDEAISFLAVRGRHDGIKRALRGLLASNPSDALLSRRLAKAVLADGNLDEAARLLARARASDPDSSDGALVEFDLLVARGRPAEARALLTRHLRREPANYELAYKLAEHALERGDYAEVHRQAEAVWLAIPNDRNRLGWAFVLSGRAYEKEGRTAEALRELLRARAMSEEWSRELAGALERSGQLLRAAAEYRRIAEREGPRSDALQRAKAIESRLGRLDGVGLGGIRAD
jgi:tetratricopeptide (TPR) repeat protein